MMYVPQSAWTAGILLGATTEKALYSPWTASDWISQDAIIRANGTSYSSLKMLLPKSAENLLDDSIVNFHGNLGYESLGGSGFASQTTVDETGPSSTFPHTTSFSWSSCLWTGITTLKNTVPSAGTKDPVSVSWGYIIYLLTMTQTEHRSVSTDLQRVMVPVKDLLATFNGRLSNKWEHLDVAGIKRISIMIGVCY